MKLFRSKDQPLRPRLAAVFRENRLALGQALFDAVRQKGCASWRAPQQFEEVQEWGRAHLLTAVDLLTQWYETSDPLYKELFAGWVQARLVPDLSAEGTPDDYKPHKAVEFTKTSWMSILRMRLPAQAIEILAEDLDQLQSSLSKPIVKALRILVIGDCLQYELMTAVLGPCAQAQICIKPVVINERVQTVLRNRIRTVAANDFDLVFFSPFSHAYLPEYEMLLNREPAFGLPRK